MTKGVFRGAPFFICPCHTFVIHSDMDIAKLKQDLLHQRTILEEQIKTSREQVNGINLKLRKMDTLIKHAESILNPTDNENGADKPADNAEGGKVRQEAGEEARA